ncbi:MAG: elongation factor Ts [Bacteroidales bacterium]|nr:elongation factor Ts [Bacteroidales bacterium]
MAEIKASDVGKLRKMTGAGMMDCKKALTEAQGDFDNAVKLIRERGLAIANKRADREATEGACVTKVSADGKFAVALTINCETDFVAKNDDFLGFANQIADIAIANKCASMEDLMACDFEGKPLNEQILVKSGVVGEKLDLSKYETLVGEFVVPYIHSNNKIATLVAINKVVDAQVGRDVAMQIAAMNPVSLDKDDVPAEIIERELEIGRQQAANEGKPEAMLDKIAQGKLGKFFKESTLLQQAFIKDGKMSVIQYLQSVDKDLTATAFKRFSLGE